MTNIGHRYLDKLFGTFHKGRVPGEQVRDAKDTKDADSAATSTAPTATATVRTAPTAPTAQYKQLKHATVLDFEVQGRAFDAYQEAGCIVDNVLGLLQNMKVGSTRVGSNRSLNILGEPGNQVVSLCFTGL
jgi:hypothetical protein